MHSRTNKSRALDGLDVFLNGKTHVAEMFEDSQTVFRL